MKTFINKKLILAMIFMFITAVLFPFPVLASETSVLSIPVVSDDAPAKLGTVFMQSSGPEISGGDVAIISLPSDFKYLRSKNSDDVMNSNTLTVDGAVYEVDDWNTLTIDGTTWINVPEKGYFKEGSTPYLTTNGAPDYYPTVIHLFHPGLGGQTISQSIKVGNPETNNFEFPARYNGDDSALFNNLGGGNYMLRTGIHVDKLDDNEIKIQVIGQADGHGFFAEPDPSNDSFMFVHNGWVYIDEGYEGIINAQVSAPSGSGISSGEIPIGRVSDGETEIEATDTNTFNDSDTVTFRITEDRPGAFEVDDESIKLILPDGFVWEDDINGAALSGAGGGANDNYEVKVIYGDTAIKGTVKVNNDGDELIIDIDDQDAGQADKQGTTQETSIEIKVTIVVDDETNANLGDIVAKVKGESDLSVSELVVGAYGEYTEKVSAADPETVHAGGTEQAIADITFEEDIEGSFVDGRIITLTLPDWAIWGALPDKVEDGVELDLTSFPGKDGHVAKYTVNATGASGAAELTFEDMEILLSPDAEEGDLAVEIGGTAGINEEIVVAKVVKPVTVEATAAPILVIGRSAQAIAEITITETGAGILKEGKDLILSLPEDIEWDDYEVEVIKGDLKLGDIDDSDEDLSIEIDDESNEVSTIKVTGTVVAYRTVPEGDVPVKVKGNALIEVNDIDTDGAETEGPVYDQYGAHNADGYYIMDDYNGNDVPVVEYDEDGLFEDDTTVAKVTVATVGTPAPSDKAMSATITLGDNGSYISDGRIMVQLRDAATALGVEPQNILWDNATKSATFIKGERVVQITVGDPQVKLNSNALPTDKGAEIKDGRTFVSLSAAGVALNAVATWDNETKTAILTVK